MLTERGAGHTKGPWRWSNQFEDSQGNETWSLLGDGGYGVLSCDGIGNSPQGLGAQGRADAALIAAAPDLLEACEALVEGMQSCGVDGPYLQQAISAIARAKGEA